MKNDLQEAQRCCDTLGRQEMNDEKNITIFSYKIPALFVNGIFRTSSQFLPFGLSMFGCKEQTLKKTLLNEFIRKRTVERRVDAKVQRIVPL